MESESQIKQIEKYNNQLFYKLFSKFPKIKKTKIDYQLQTKNKTEKCTPINIIYYNKKNKLWFAKTQTNNDHLYLFGKYDESNGFKIDKPILRLNFNKKEIYHKDCSGILHNNSSNLNIYMNITYFKENIDGYNLKIKDFNKKTITIFDNSIPKNIETINLGNLNQDFTTNLIKLIKCLDSNETPITGSSINNCHICSKTLNKEDKEFNKKLQITNSKLCSECIEKILCLEFYNETKNLFNTSYMAVTSLKNEYDNKFFNYCFKLLEKHNFIKYMGSEKKYFYYSPNNTILTNDSYKQFKLLPSLKNNNETNQIKSFIKLLNEGQNPDDIAKNLKIPNFKIKNWYNQGKLGNKKYIEFYKSYLKATSKNCEICKELIPQDIESNICKECSKKAYCASILNLLLKHVDPLIPFKAKDFEDMGYPSTYVNNYIKILKENDLINRKYNTYSLKDYSILNGFLEIYESYGKKLNVQLDYNNKPARLSKTCEKCKNTFVISKFSKVQNNPSQYKDICKDCENEILIQSKDKNQVNACIKMMNEGKDLEEIMKTLEITKDNIEDWCKKGKEKIPIYKEFYNKYTDLTSKHCEICGKTLKINTKKTTCKKCSKKIHAASILKELSQSVDSGVPFRAEDLKIIGYDKIKIKDCIWTLQETNLIDEKNGKYILKNKKILDKFLEKYGNESNNPQKPKPPLKLSKKCKICGKILPLRKFFKNKENKDGYEDYCKSCKKPITAARCLKELLKNLEMGKTYSEDKIKHYYDSEFNFTSKIWSMLDFDLITHDINKKEYTIANEKTCEKFLNKYYIEKKEKSIELTSLTKQEQMNIVINTISEGKTNEEAAKLAGIPTYKIIHWKNEGKQGNGKDNIEFYKKYNEALKTVNANEEKIKELVVLLLTKCETLEKAAKFIENGKYEEKIKDWYNLGKQNDKRHTEFYNECIELINLSSMENNCPVGILEPLPQEYEDSFKSTKNTSTGFAWLNKVGDNWLYQRQINKKPLKISNSNLVELYNEVKNQGYVWGVRDFEKAQHTLEISGIKNINYIETKEDTTPNIKKEDINMISIETKSIFTEVIIKGTIKNTELINLLNYLKEFEKNINKLISTNNKEYTDIFIEMKLEDSELEILTDKLNKLNQ